MATSDVDICNRALQKLGAGRITSLNEDSPNAHECNVAYEAVRDAELRDHVWSFARKRAQLAADTATPDFGYSYQYELPVDCLRVLPGRSVTDWQIEGTHILTDDGAPLEVVYVKKVTDPNEMDSLFREVLAARLAWELAEVITQSNTKKAEVAAEYREAIAKAKRTNAIERVSDEPPDDEWVTARL